MEKSIAVATSVFVCSEGIGKILMTMEKALTGRSMFLQPNRERPPLAGSGFWQCRNRNAPRSCCVEMKVGTVGLCTVISKKSWGCFVHPKQSGNAENLRLCR